MNKEMLIFKRNPSTIKMRLTLWYLCIMALVLIIFSSFLFWNIKQNLYLEVKKHLQIQAEEILSRYQKTLISNNTSFLIDISKKTRQIIPANFKIGFYDKSNHLVTNSQFNKIIPVNISSPTNNKFNIQDVKTNKIKWAILTLPVENNKNIIGWFRLAYSLKKEQNTLHNLLIFFIVGIPVTLIIASGGGYFLAAKSLEPIDRITKTTNMISSSNLSQRIKPKKTNNEIGRLIDTLNHLLNRLEEAFNREKRFAADASHELRTPVSVIKAYTEKALSKQYTVEEYQQTLSTIHKKTEYMNHLIEQLLLLAHSDTDDAFMDKEKLNLSELIKVVVAEMKDTAKTNNISLTVDIKDNLLIYGDQSMLIQLVINLIDNAIKYTAQGGNITISAQSLKNHIMMTINDSGIGISRKDQKYIFDSFYRVDKSRSRTSGGTGLGLTICKRIVEIHGGKIDVDSKPDEGTSFTIYLLKYI